MRTWTIIRTIVFGTLFLSLWTYFFPTWLNMVRFDLPSSFTGIARLRWLGIIPLVVGLVLAWICAFEFAWKGRGTPAPMDPPRELVVVGPYRYVRNPMYCGLGLLLLGESVLFFEDLLATLVYFAAILLLVNIFVRAYEEPALRRKFGERFDEYLQNVPRWIPQLHPWTPAPRRYTRLRQ